MRLRIFRREPEALFWTFGFPLVVTLVLGIAFRPSAPEPLPVVVVGGAEDAALVEQLARSGELDVRLVGAAEAVTALGRGGALLVVEPGQVPVLRYDATRPESRLARAIAEAAIDGRASESSESRQSSEAGDRYVDFLVPGLIAMNVMTVCLWGIGWNVVDARKSRLLRRLAVVPMRRTHYLGSFLIAHVVLVIATLAVVIGFAALAFDVPLEGSVLGLVFVIGLGSASFSGLGVLLASRTANVEVLSGMINAASLLQLIGSGVFFSTSHFPDAVVTGLRALPLTALVDAVRAIMLEGRPLQELPLELGVLTVWMAITSLVGLRIFRWS